MNVTIARAAMVVICIFVAATLAGAAYTLA
ncbi:hypothetical protein HDE71_005029 [Janthinobacterium sp. S3M3]|nr:hypothetical protein [Janthinobacterium sp. S3T4]MBB5615951.1 hypothetical protein [Janthinobacterium sp. S3M3]